MGWKLKLNLQLSGTIELVTEPELPGPFAGFGPVTMTGEHKENDMILRTYEVPLLPVPDLPENEDIIIQRITINTDGTQHEIVDVPVTESVVRFEVPADVLVKLYGQYIDDAVPQNQGPLMEGPEFVASDTQLPGPFGGFGAVTMVGERDDGT